MDKFDNAAFHFMGGVDLEPQLVPILHGRCVLLIDADGTVFR